MTRLQHYIKSKRFSLNTMDQQLGWRQGKMDLTYRITFITEEAWHTRINIYVKGKIEDRKAHNDPDGKATMREATDVVYRPRGMSWECDWRRRSVIWGDEYHKNIRSSIRQKAASDLHYFFKLIGKTKRIEIGKVNFEK